MVFTKCSEYTIVLETSCEHLKLCESMQNCAKVRKTAQKQSKLHESTEKHAKPRKAKARKTAQKHAKLCESKLIIQWSSYQVSLFRYSLHPHLWTSAPSLLEWQSSPSSASSCIKFHLHFESNFSANFLVPIKNKAELQVQIGCAFNFRTKKLIIKCRWNWHQYLNWPKFEE